MNLLEQARKDIAQILSGDFSQEIVLTSTDSQVAQVRGIHSKIHQGVDMSTGNSVRSKKASVTVYENDITTANAGYPVRKNNEVHLKGHIIEVADSTGVTKRYVAEQWFPDEMTGHIVIILGAYAD